MSLSNIIHMNLKGFLDIIFEGLVGISTLMEIKYAIVANKDENTLLIKVSGDANYEIEGK